MVSTPQTQVNRRQLLVNFNNKSLTQLVNSSFPSTFSRNKTISIIKITIRSTILKRRKNSFIAIIVNSYIIIVERFKIIKASLNYHKIRKYQTDPQPSTPPPTIMNKFTK